MENKEQNIKARIVSFIKELSQSKVFPENIDLIESGVLDSFSFVELIVFLEKQFNIKVNPFEVRIEDLHSVDSLVSFVMRKNGGG